MREKRTWTAKHGPLTSQKAPWRAGKVGSCAHVPGHQRMCVPCIATVSPVNSVRAGHAGNRSRGWRLSRRGVAGEWSRPLWGVAESLGETSPVTACGWAEPAGANTTTIGSMQDGLTAVNREACNASPRWAWRTASSFRQHRDRGLHQGAPEGRSNTPLGSALLCNASNTAVFKDTE